MVANRVLISHSLNAHATARLTPPVTLEEADIAELLAAAEASLTAIHHRYFPTQDVTA